ncbi:Aminopeptidase N [Actinomyces bovis]|uniref:Aminopeptidase N n=2 Tax=Actinomyces bovis TaxID=1658 RepID=A0ABY1VRE3_9ACTO|nr:Aminopeptidase N [Actinomyces bovis]VEG53888.1 Aminopeptidase N [Actinomyces israelii]
MKVTLDLTQAPQASATCFTVRTELTVTVQTAVPDGAWVDFLGESIAEVLVDGVAQDPDWDGYRVQLPSLQPGQHNITIDAVGHFSNTGQGLHRFQDPVDGATYLYTHFEPADARRAWPCLEQPDLKAPFTLTVTHPQGWTLLSNGVLAAKATAEGAPGMEVTHFASTKPLPSYLTALAAGPWHQVTGEWRSTLRPTDPPVPLSWSCRASLAQHLDAKELLAITATGLDLYDRSYGFPYPWGSYDSVLVPEYNLGAMENPGCVTFNEDHYLFQGPATRAQRGERANVIMHEMCHMWFGDLVTPKWWEDTWLKESFADHQGTWAQAEATEFSDAWVAFAAGRKAWAYEEDARAETTHPIVATVEDIEAARQTFDGITYAKGAAVLKQLVAYAGQEAFTQAARQLFQAHAYGNATLADLMQVLSAATGKDMEAWAQAWLHTCAPSIINNHLEVQDGRIKSLRLTQQCTDPRTDTQVLRPHTLKVGLYSCDGVGALVRTHSLPVTFAAPEVRLSDAVGLPAPDLVTVNDEDLTYAVVRPDAASVQVVLHHLKELKDPLTRAVWWSVLHNLMRDALLHPAWFIAAVLSQADDSTAPATLAKLLQQARLATRYLPTVDRLPALLSLAGAAGEVSGPDAWTLLKAAPAGSDAQLVRARAWVNAAGELWQAKPKEIDQTAKRLRALLVEEGLPGLKVDHELRWSVLTSLARLGRLQEAEIVAQEQADPSAGGVTAALRVRHAAPEAGMKELVFERLLTERSLSNDHLDALLAAFSSDSHLCLTATFTERYLAALPELWAQRGQEVATRLVNGLFPHAGGAVEAELVRSWLGEHRELPRALGHLLHKYLADLKRSLQCQTTSFAD